MTMHRQQHSSISLLLLQLILLLFNLPTPTAAFSSVHTQIITSSRNNDRAAPSSVSLTSTIQSTAESSDISPSTRPQRKVAILLCPAQFCVPADYTSLLSSIASSSPHLPANVQIVSTATAPLPRTEWIKVAKQLPTRKFVEANLDVTETLGWYFDAIEEGLAELFACGAGDVGQ
jgi:hypothetical protein